MKKNILYFTGNPAPAFRRAQPATIGILPVISIVRFPTPPSAMPPSKRLRRLRNLQKLLAE